MKMLLFPVLTRHVTAQHSMVYCNECSSFRYLFNFSIHIHKGIPYNVLLQCSQMSKSKTERCHWFWEAAVCAYHQQRWINGKKKTLMWEMYYLKLLLYCLPYGFKTENTQRAVIFCPSNPISLLLFFSPC